MEEGVATAKGDIPENVLNILILLEANKMDGLILLNIGKISKKTKTNDGKYEYKIELKNVYKESAYPDLGSEISITDSHSNSVLSNIDKIKIVSVGGTPYIIDKDNRIGYSYVIKNKQVINLEDTIIIIANKEIDNCNIHFPKAKFST